MLIKNKQGCEYEFTPVDKYSVKKRVTYPTLNVAVNTISNDEAEKLIVKLLSDHSFNIKF